MSNFENVLFYRRRINMEITADTAIEMLKYLPSRPDYDDWLKIISAVGNYFGESEALYILRTRFNDETADETARKLRNRLRNVNIGTLIHLAKKYGYTFKNSGITDITKAHRKYNRALKKSDMPKYLIKDKPDFIFNEVNNCQKERIYRHSTDCARFFYGNSNSILYNLKDKNKIKYSGGKLCCQ
jgi:hypothetical protein